MSRHIPEPPTAHLAHSGPLDGETVHITAGATLTVCTQLGTDTEYTRDDLDRAHREGWEEWEYESDGAHLHLRAHRTMPPVAANG